MSDILLTNNPSYNQAGKEEVYNKTQKQISSYLHTQEMHTRERNYEIRSDVT
jgi:hypothetical protein